MNLTGSLCTYWITYVILLSRYFLSLFFNLYYNVSSKSFAFIMLGDCWDSWVHRWTFCQIWDFIHYFFNMDIFFVAFSVSSPTSISIAFNSVLHFSEFLLYLFILSLFSSYFLIAVNLSSSLLTVLAQIYSCLSKKFSFIILYCTSQLLNWLLVNFL